MAPKRASRADSFAAAASGLQKPGRLADLALRPLSHLRLEELSRLVQDQSWAPPGPDRYQNDATKPWPVKSMRHPRSPDAGAPAPLLQSARGRLESTREREMRRFSDRLADAVSGTAVIRHVTAPVGTLDVPGPGQYDAEEARDNLSPRALSPRVNRDARDTSPIRATLKSADSTWQGKQPQHNPVAKAMSISRAIMQGLDWHGMKLQQPMMMQQQGFAAAGGSGSGDAWGGGWGGGAGAGGGSGHYHYAGSSHYGRAGSAAGSAGGGWGALDQELAPTSEPLRPSSAGSGPRPQSTAASGSPQRQARRSPSPQRGDASVAQFISGDGREGEEGRELYHHDREQHEHCPAGRSADDDERDSDHRMQQHYDASSSGYDHDHHQQQRRRSPPRHVSPAGDEPEPSGGRRTVTPGWIEANSVPRRSAKGLRPPPPVVMPPPPPPSSVQRTMRARNQLSPGSWNWAACATTLQNFTTQKGGVYGVGTKIRVKIQHPEPAITLTATGGPTGGGGMTADDFNSTMSFEGGVANLRGSGGRARSAPAPAYDDDDDSTAGGVGGYPGYRLLSQQQRRGMMGASLVDPLDMIPAIPENKPFTPEAAAGYLVQPSGGTARAVIVGPQEMQRHEEAAKAVARIDTMLQRQADWKRRSGSAPPGKPLWGGG